LELVPVDLSADNDSLFVSKSDSAAKTDIGRKKKKIDVQVANVNCFHYQ
jgi:hypothetical protein